MSNELSTGPVFLGQQDLLPALRDLVGSARKYVLLVSPYVRLGKLRNFGRVIEQALGRKVAVTLVVRAPDASTSPWDTKDVEETERLVKAGLKLFMVPDLHAKVYVSEAHAILTSINLVESSFNNSIELGVLLAQGTAGYDQLAALVRRDITDLKLPVTSIQLASSVSRPSEGGSRSRFVRGGEAAGGRRYARGPARDGVPDEDADLEEDEDACWRCGRVGHWADDCYARTTVDGQPLDDEEDD